MAIIARCGTCGQEYKVPDSYAGRTGRCVNCGKTFTAPGQAAPMSVAAPGGVQKLCVVCGQDVAGKPRTKDPKGRYYCQPCYDALMGRDTSLQTVPPVAVLPEQEMSEVAVAEPPPLPAAATAAIDAPAMAQEDATSEPDPLDFADLAPTQPIDESAQPANYTFVHAPAPTRRIRRTKSSGGSLDVQSRVLLAMLGGCGILAIGALAAPFGLSTIFSHICIWLGAVSIMVAGLWVLVLAFQESIWVGLLYALVPFYSLYFFVTRWSVVKRPFLASIVAFGLILAGLSGLSGGGLGGTTNPFGVDFSDFESVQDEVFTFPGERQHSASPAQNGHSRRPVPAGGRRN